MAINKKTSFSVEGLRAIRANPDGTPVSPDRVLGFSGTVDLSAIVANAADMTIKIDGSAETLEVDWTAAVDKTAVTVAEMATAINLAGFTDITASTDTDTGRLLIVYDGSETPDTLQVYDPDTDKLASQLDFGQGIVHGGDGAKFVRCFDNTVSVGLPKNIKDIEEIEAESGDGTLITIIVPALLKGLKPVITMSDNDLALKQLIQGGTYNSVTNTYTPPNTSNTTKPIFTIEMFAPVYGKGTNQKEDLAGYERIYIPSCTGIEGDLTKDTKALGSYLFNLSASEYEDELGAKHSAWIEQILSQTEFNALDVENV